jgi:hypothetical protein
MQTEAFNWTIIFYQHLFLLLNLRYEYDFCNFLGEVVYVRYKLL